MHLASGVKQGSNIHRPWSAHALTSVAGHQAVVSLGRQNSQTHQLPLMCIREHWKASGEIQLPIVCQLMSNPPRNSEVLRKRNHRASTNPSTGSTLQKRSALGRVYEDLHSHCCGRLGKNSLSLGITRRAALWFGFHLSCHSLLPFTLPFQSLLKCPQTILHCSRYKAAV